MKNKMNIIILFLLPLIILVEIYLFTLFAEMIRQKSDISVVISILLVSFIIIFNFYLIKFIKSNFRK
jgi:hypothetical protein